MISRQDRCLKEPVRNPYDTSLELSQPAVCPMCHAVFFRGRWHWRESWPADARNHDCEACRRVQDQHPAGVITLEGDFLEAHRAGILQLIQNLEIMEKAAHPLNRIMQILEYPDFIAVVTTDIHLPRRIGEALRRFFKGNLILDYEQETHFVRVLWSR